MGMVSWDDHDIPNRDARFGCTVWLFHRHWDRVCPEQLSCHHPVWRSSDGWDSPVLLWEVASTSWDRPNAWFWPWLKFCPALLATNHLLLFELIPPRRAWRVAQSAVPVKEPEGLEQSLPFVLSCAFVSKTISCQPPSATFIDTWSTLPCRWALILRYPSECSVHTQTDTEGGLCQPLAK